MAAAVFSHWRKRFLPTRSRPASAAATSLSAVLDKAAAYAEAKKVEPAVLLNTRLAPDMFPLVRQVRAATDHAIPPEPLPA